MAAPAQVFLTRHGDVHGAAFERVDAEALADGDALAERVQNRLQRGGGETVHLHVVVLALAAHERVAHTAADIVRPSARVSGARCELPDDGSVVLQVLHGLTSRFRLLYHTIPPFARQ